MGESVFESDPSDHGPNGQAVSKPADDDLNRFLEDTLGSVLRSARESATEMVQRAKRAAEEEASRTEQLHATARAEVERMSAWRVRIDPLVVSANDKADAIQRAVADVSARVAEALAPINAALADMDQVLARLTDALRPPTDGPDDHDGPGGPGGPNGGSRSIVPFADAPSAVQPDRELVGVVPEHPQAMDVPDVPARTFEAPRDQNDQAQVASSTVVGFVRPDAVASEPDDVDASEQPDDVQASAEPEGATASAAPDDADDDAVDADAPAAVAPADVAQDSLGPRRDDAADEGAMRTETAPQSVTTPPKWVDWSWNAKGPVSVPGPTSRLGNGGDSGGPDEDDAGLRSATSQLRRAVTDIDWNDLPSASNG